MNEKLKAYIDSQNQSAAQLQQKEREKALIAAGLFEKDYAPKNNTQFEDYPEWDPKVKERYRKVAIPLTDDEYAEFQKYAALTKGADSASLDNKDNKSDEDLIQKIVTGCAIMIFVLAIILGGFFFLEYNAGLGSAIFASLTVLSIFALGLARIINLLNEINAK